MEYPPESIPSLSRLAADISNVTLILKQDAGETNGDGYYTVKIDNWVDQAPSGGDDLDEDIADITAYLIVNDVFIFHDSTLCGAIIKGGFGGEGAREGTPPGSGSVNGSADYNYWLSPRAALARGQP